MPNFLDVTISSMSNKFEYLVKYSVAPPPSRDYYGLKVLQNEIILHLWRISYGPHKAPIVHRVKFAEFYQEKSLQDEIRRGFAAVLNTAGEYLLQHVKNIAEGNRNTLLTLPKSLIERLSRYLKFTDIVKLASLSHVAYEVFNADSLWQILFKRDKKVKIIIEEREKIKIYGWKQLYKYRQMQTSIKSHKNFRIQLSTNYASDAKVNKPSLRPTSGILMPKTTSIINVAAKGRSKFSNMDLVTRSLSKTTFDTQFRDTNANVENKKSCSQKKNPNSKLSMNEKNVKKENFITSKVITTLPPKVITNREIKGIFKHGKGIDNQQNKLEKCTNKINVNVTLQESKTEPIVSKTSLSKNTVKNFKSSSNIVQKSHDRIRSKIKTKSKKLTTTKSEVFNADKELSDNPFVVRDGDLDLADLIEASLKNIRSPRSIFDYDFSCMQSDVRKDILKSKNEIQDIDKLKQLKSMRGSVITNYLSDKMTRGNEILEKLSEKSEPFSETSCESLVNDKKVLSAGDNESLSLSEKYMKTRAELQKSLDWRSGTLRNDTVSSENRWHTIASFRNQLQSPRKFENSNEKPNVRGPLKTSILMKTYGSRNLESKKDLFAKNSETVTKNQIESTKVVKDIGRN